MGFDDRTREDLKRWLRTARVYSLTFVGGGVFAFACTYYPLHSAKDREIHQLEDRLRQESIRFTEFEGELGTLRAQTASQPDRDAFDKLQVELAGAMTLKSEYKEDLDRADRKARDAENSRDRWKAESAKMEKSRNDLADALIVANASLKSAAQLAMNQDRALDSSPSPTGSSRTDEYGNDRGSNLASADAVDARPANRDFWETGSGPHPRSSSSAPEANQAGAK